MNKLEEMYKETIELDALEKMLKARVELNKKGIDQVSSPEAREIDRWFHEEIQEPGFFLKRGISPYALEILKDGEDTADLTIEADKEGVSHFSKTGYQLEEDCNVDIVRHMRYYPGDFHDHDFIEMAYMISGECSHEFRVDGNIVKSHMEKGSVLIIPPGLAHRVEIFDDSVMLNILVRTDTFHKAFLAKFPENTIIFKYFANVLYSKKHLDYILLHTDGDDILDELIMRMLIELKEGRPYCNQACDRYLEIWFLELLRHLKELVGTYTTDKYGINPLVLSILMYIQANCETASLSTIEEKYNFTPAYLNRIFKKETGTTIQKYIVEMKMQNAREFVIRTDMNIGDIAEKMGYSDQSFFIEQYKKAYGQTPLQTRKTIHSK